MRSALVKTFGFSATLVHGDPLVLDRWLWLKKHLPAVPDGSCKLIDVGCGTGAFTIGAARRGYRSLGLSWDERNQRVAAERAVLCKAPLAAFQVVDVRRLAERSDYFSQFDVAICLETIEHIINDELLMSSIARCLKPGGTLLLTTPNSDYRPMGKGDVGPWHLVEDGGHVRKGYSADDLRRLCKASGLAVSEVSYCSGFLSQKITVLQRLLTDVHWTLSWALTLPLRVLPPLLDGMCARITRWPGYSITLVASKPPEDPETATLTAPREASLPQS